MSEAISVGSVSVDIVPDTRKLPEDLKAKTRDLTITVGTKLDDSTLKREMDELTRDRQVAIRANLDDTGAAARLDELTRERTIKVKADTSQARKEMAGLKGLGGSMGLLPSLAMGLGPGLIPIGAAALGGLGALGVPAAAAGGGLAIGSFIAKAAVKRTETQLKRVDQLRKKMLAAEQAAANVGAGSSAGNSSAAASTTAANQSAAARRAAQLQIGAAEAAVARARTPTARQAAEQRVAAAQASLANHEATISASLSARQASISAAAASRQAAAQRKVAEATAAYKAALAGLSPAQLKFKNSQDAMKASFDRLIRTAGPSILGPVTKGMDLLSKVMPKLVPILEPVANSIGSLLNQVGKAASSKQFGDFVTWFGKLAGSSITSFGHDLGNLALGFGGLFKAFAPLSGGLLSSIGTMTQKFADFGEHASSNKGVQGFLDYVRREGPKVASALDDIAGVAVNLVKGLAPWGDVVLGAVDGIASFLKTAKPSTIDALAISVGGLLLAFGKGPLGLLAILAGIGAHSKGFVSFLKAAGGYAKDMADAFDRLPAGIKVAAAAALGVGIVGKKMTGSFTFGLLGQGAKGLADKVLGTSLSKMTPIPVYVVNDPTKAGGGGGKAGWLAFAAKWALRTSPVTLPLLTSGDTAPGQPTAGATPKQLKAHHSMISAMTGLYSNLGLDKFGFNKAGQGADDVLSKMVRDDPGKAFRIIKKAADEAGVSISAFATQGMPKTQHAIHDATVEFGSLKAAIDGRTRGAEALARELGIVAQNANDAANALKAMGSIYAGLPKDLVAATIANHQNKFDQMTGPRGHQFVHNGDVKFNSQADYLRWQQSRAIHAGGGGVAWP